MRSGGASAISGPYFGYRDTLGHKTVGAFKAVGRLVIPVALLLGVLMQILDYSDVILPFLPGSDGNYWLNGAHLLLPAAFFVVHLTNRRYGPGYAFAQIAVTFAAVLAFILFAKEDADLFVRPEAVPTMRIAAAFGGGFFVAGFLSIVAFDGARGPCWWSAPLVGFLTAAIVFPSVYYPIAYIGVDSPWMMDGLTYMGLLGAAAIAMLFPYYLLRGIVPPQPGFGGY